MKIQVNRAPKPKSKVSPMIKDLVDYAIKCRNGDLTIGTHDGTFHADELIGIAIIDEAVHDYLEERKELHPVHISIVRSRDPKNLAGCDVLVDVGNSRYDHHAGAPEFYPNGIPISSCGKVLEDVETDPSIKSFLLGAGLYIVQAADNGYEGTIKWSEKGEVHAPSMAYLNKTNPFAFVPYMNETYSEKFNRNLSGITSNNAFFQEAYLMVRNVYRRMRLKILDRINIRSQMWSLPVLLDGKILDLPDSSYPWQEFIFRTNPHGNRNIVAVIYPHASDVHAEGYCVRLVPTNIKGFGQRIEFPPTWLTWQRLHFSDKHKPSSLVDLGCSYIHSGGNLAVFDSKEHAIAAVEYCCKRANAGVQ